MKPVAPRTGMIDLRHNAVPQVIAAAVLETGRGIAIVDPGPGSTLPALEEGLTQTGASLADVHAILLTHIHLDHAGATGSILRMAPNARVYVHPVGAPHMADPSRLLRSATRLFGPEMDRLWGDFLPVARERIVTLDDGQPLDLDGVTLESAHTPGHAAHHVCFFDPSTGIAFVGDAAGARIADARLVLPATPPPDIDPDLILASLDRVLSWTPEQLFLTHFGLATDTAFHAHDLRTRLADWSEHVRRSLDPSVDDAELAANFGEQVGAEMRRLVSPSVAESFERGAGPTLSWYGLARYWRNQPSGS